MAGQGGGSADPGDPGRPRLPFWRRRPQAEADAREDAKAQAAQAEQQARAAQDQLAAARRERDEAITGAQSQAAEAESRASQAGQDAGEPAREDRTEAELQRPGACRDKAAGQPARQQPKSTTRRGRHPRKK